MVRDSSGSENSCRKVQPFDGVSELLSGHGLGDDAVKALMSFETTMFHFHRRMVKGELAAVILRHLGLEIETAQFQCLMAVGRITLGIGGHEPRPATVGMVAEELAIDPSRASRLVADLVGRDLAVRVAAQDDGRKSPIELSKAGLKILGSVRDARWQMLAQIFGEWSEKDIRVFANLFDRYLEDSDRFLQGFAANDVQPE